MRLTAPKSILLHDNNFNHIAKADGNCPQTHKKDNEFCNRCYASSQQHVVSLALRNTKADKTTQTHRPTVVGFLETNYLLPKKLCATWGNWWK